MRILGILVGLVCLVCVSSETPPELVDIATSVPIPWGPDNTTTTSTTTPTPPTTTTVPTTTTPSTTTSTTTVPTTTTTTTTSPSTTTLGPKPTPPRPNPEIGNWTVTDTTRNVTCIVARMAIYLVLPYTRADGQIVNGSLAVPPNATATGTCGLNQTLVLTWTTPVPGTLIPTGPNSLTFHFRKNETSANATALDQLSSIDRNQYAVSSIDVVVVPDPINFPNAVNGTISASLRDVDIFITSLNRSYRCQTEQRVPLIVNPSLSNNETTGALYLTHTQLEAYHGTRDTSFSSAMDCRADGITSDIVPIAVGCALAALVVVVLLAYLIGRRRARQRGYQSV